MFLTHSLDTAQDIDAIGPLVSTFSNSSDAGRNKNSRVELVER
jgi:hypothetical protein